MKRADGAASLAAALAEDAVVIASLGTSGRAWRDHGGENLTYYASDPMGTAPAFALGAAVSRPDLQFVLLEGDGDLVMNLGVLLTIARTAPSNLHVVVTRNGCYETGGGQPLGAPDGADLAAMAVAAGWTHARNIPAVTTPDAYRDFLSVFLGMPGPAIAVVEMESEPSPYGGPGQYSGGEARLQFQEALAARHSAG
ncbi:thiamine pyrophosphate-dependent enzyme [Rhodococcus sp. NPDC060084]|uniref:thiamine pyrophosphate-dependent enzyme n=1 Tax=Rhodococcus sp. NPDC060084 TaxID=3347053 RepID=UPI003663EF7D